MNKRSPSETRAVVSFVKNDAVGSFEISDDLAMVRHVVAHARKTRTNAFLGFTDLTGCPRTVRVSDLLSVEEIR